MGSNVINKALRYIYLHGYLYRVIEKRHKEYVHQLRQRDGEVRVVFFAMSVSMWRYQHLYELMLNNERFSPVIIISPSVDYNIEQQRHDAQALREYFNLRGMSYVDWREGEPVDVKDKLDPDVLFYPQPYENLLTPKHDVTSFYDRLVCYFPYAFWTSTGKWSYDFHFHNLAWRLYYSSKYHQAEARKTAWNKGRNVRVVGYPNADDFLSGKYADVWKKSPDGKTRKRLIWAPHYAVTPEFGLIARSNFLMMAEPMLELARKFNDDLQIAFKPHPRLLTELYRHPQWGKDRTDAYYNEWKNGSNTQLETGGFVDLFMTSDAMVHDSGSFAVEYHYSLNPVMFVSTDMEPLLATQGELGKAAYKMHYIGKNMAEIERFVIDVVLGDKDSMRSWREWFFNEYLLPPGGKSVAQNTIDDLIYSLFVDEDEQ